MRRSLEDVAAGLARGELTALSLVDHAIAARQARVGSPDPYIVFDAERARAGARASDARIAAGARGGLLHGIPVSVKDNFGVPGWRVYAGSPRPLPPRWESSGPLIRRLEDQAAVIVGKTHMAEFAFGALGMNGHWGALPNPRDTAVRRASGGSSTGAPLSLLEGSALLALGTDTAGSVRIPASLCGLAGLKTSRGLWSIEGIVPLSPRQDTPGLLAWDAADLAFAFSALTGEPVPPPASLTTPIRVGRLHERLWEGCGPGIVEAVEAALAGLAESFRDVGTVAVPELGAALDMFERGGLAGYDLFHFLETELPDWLPTLDRYVRDPIMASQAITREDYEERCAFVGRFARGTQEVFREVDVLVSPTVALSPPAIAELEDLERYAPANLLALRNCCVANLADFCAVTLPIGNDRQGLPVGLQVMGPLGGDAHLLAVARRMEDALGLAANR